MGALASLFWKKDPKTPIKGIVPRLKNVAIRNYKGLIGTIVPLIVVPLTVEKNVHWKTMRAIWATMAWFFLWQPVNIPVTGLIPIFALPMFGAMSSDKTCASYMNEGMLLFILGNMVLLLWNNCGLDRRVILWILCAGDTVQFSARKLVFKCCIAGFFLSMMSNRLIVTNIMIEYITPILTSMHSASTKGAEANYEEMRYIVIIAIYTSCAIGGVAIVHSSFGTLCFRTIYQMATAEPDMSWTDHMNFLEYTMFAFPMALVMLIFNCSYLMVLAGLKCGKPMTSASMSRVKTDLLNQKKNIPKKITTHETLSLFFSIMVLAAYFTRWNKYFGGWAESFGTYNDVPGLRDTTVAAAFAVILHSLPCGFRFITMWRAKKKSQIGAIKPESGILWWRFVDRNINYGYIFLIGSGVALAIGVRHTKYSVEFATTALAKLYSSQTQIISSLLICVTAVLGCNIMSGVAFICIFMPFVINLYATKPVEVPKDPAGGGGGGAGGEGGGGGARRFGTSDFYMRSSEKVVANADKIYYGALAVGIAGSLGFTCPFLFTPTYFAHFTGKVPRIKLAMYGAGSALICCLILWACISFYAPIIWPASTIKQVAIKVAEAVTTTTTLKPE